MGEGSPPEASLSFSLFSAESATVNGVTDTDPGFPRVLGDSLDLQGSEGMWGRVQPLRVE